MFYVKTCFILCVLLVPSVYAANWLNVTNVGSMSLNNLALRVVNSQGSSCQRCEAAAHMGFVAGFLSSLRTQIAGMPGYADRFSADCYVPFLQTVDQVNCAIDFSDQSAHTIKLSPTVIQQPYAGYRNLNSFHEFFSKTFVTWTAKPIYLISTGLFKAFVPVTPTPPTPVPATGVPTTPAPLPPPTPVPTSPSSGLLAAWGQAGGVYADGTSQASRYTVSGGVVTDTLTSMQWEQAVSSSSMTWSAASTYCAGQTTGGLTGWRLPNIGELQTLVDYTINTYGPAVAINPISFPGAPATDLWSATSEVGQTGYSWLVSFSGRGPSKSGPVITNNAVRCVRSSYTLPPGSRYTVASGEVTDIVTGLIWQKVANGGTMGQTVAVSYCSGLGLNGQTWRLPTIRELPTLIHYSMPHGNLRMDWTVFAGEPAGWYWSSTAVAGDSRNNVWGADFYGGLLSSGSLSSGLLFNGAVFSAGYVRCVR